MSHLKSRLILGLLCCAVIAVGVTLSGPIELQMPTSNSPVDVLPPAEIEVVDSPDTEFSELADNRDEGSRVRQVIIILVSLLVAFLLARGARRGLQLLGGSFKSKEKTERTAGQTALADPSDQVLLPHLHQAIHVGQGHLEGAKSSADSIIAAWLALEQGAKTAGVDRNLAQTPTEFTLTVLDRTPASAQITNELLGLYQRARFTDDDLESDARSRAIAIMSELETQFAQARNASSTTGNGHA